MSRPHVCVKPCALEHKMVPAGAAHVALNGPELSVKLLLVLEPQQREACPDSSEKRGALTGSVCAASRRTSPSTSAQ